MREQELGGLSRESLVNSRKSCQLRFHICLILLVQENFQETGIVVPESGSFSDDVSWINKIFQNSIVNRCQSSASWPLLSLDMIVSGGFGQDSPLSNDDNMLSTELLLQLTHQSGLDLVIVGEELIRNEENDGFLGALSQRNLFRRRDIQVSQLSSEIVGVGFNLGQSLSNCLFSR